MRSKFVWRDGDINIEYPDQEEKKKITTKGDNSTQLKEA